MTDTNQTKLHNLYPKPRTQSLDLRTQCNHNQTEISTPNSHQIQNKTKNHNGNQYSGDCNT
ncbi:7863_t:CDS:2 [Acaulospora colombiana]|uniref:7863_t:CDS:1 n=1 Tax=Acaulospora colombiana TaxID=27376 RepID=A0ACA9KD19_9GLOM|nr:7863_t:CDS:2 [Acaulospora colombiana]